jgi:hypothetical protein
LAEEEGRGHSVVQHALRRIVEVVELPVARRHHEQRGGDPAQTLFAR